MISLELLIVSLYAQYGKLSSDVQSRLFNNTVHTSMRQRLEM